MKKIALILASIILLSSAAMLSGCGDKKKTDSSGSGSTATSDQAVKPDTDKVFVIKTKYGDLKYPKRWEKQVKTKIKEGDVYTVSFTYGDKTGLFDLNFGGGDGYLLGTLKHEGKDVQVFADDKELDNKAKNYDDLCIMQEDMNTIMQYLAIDYDFKAGGSANTATVAPTESNEVYEIKTSIGTLKYPKKWQKKVTTKESGDTVAFYSDDVKIFELQLGGKDGFSAGKLNGKDLRIVTYEFDEKKLGQQRFDELCAMQDDLNVILDNLKKTGDYSEK